MDWTLQIAKYSFPQRAITQCYKLSISAGYITVYASLLYVPWLSQDNNNVPQPYFLVHEEPRKLCRLYGKISKRKCICMHIFCRIRGRYIGKDIIKQINRQTNFENISEFLLEDSSE